ncbi:alpha/beta fold hydrolase [Caldalkalibacillus mannanilyticus]|uniref:alpha/beta fold hydrolase n=1 Tax=Caldalkalibacillus mannanilyticus TaxID=1418 RepID=UPI000469021C|nr:alpha/beta fold hydrolase [Caldalkalibacillus mannanilyticus]
MSTFVFVHGAFHGGWVWSKVSKKLEEAGHRAVSLDLPSHGMDQTPPSQVTLKDYVDCVCKVLDQEQEPVILVGHSMGGMVITQVAEYRPSKIRTLVYLCASIPQNGASLIQTLEQDKYLQPLPILVSEDQTFLTLDQTKTKDRFYGECSQQDATDSLRLLCSQPVAPLLTPIEITEENFGRVPKIYIETLKDQAISLQFQRELQENNSFQQVLTLDTDHSPFFSQTEALVKHLSSII